MRLLAWLFIALVVGVVGFYGAVMLASESGEVVTIWTRDADDRKHDTRLWIVDSAGAEWLRAGHPNKGWFLRIRVDPRVDVERAGTISAREAATVSDPATVRAVNDAFARKYGVADWIVALSGDASKRVPVRLDPAKP